MKVIVNEKKGFEYPCLMITDTGTLVLFKEFGEGTCLSNGGSLVSRGEFSKTWNMDRFKPFTGTVTLSNED